MSNRVKLILLAALLAIFAVVLYLNWGRAPQLLGIQASDAPFMPLDVDSPALKGYLLQRIRDFKYSGRHDNIFVYRAPRQPAMPAIPVRDPNLPPDPPPGPPPLVLPYRFFGYVMNLPSGNRRGFFQNGEDIFIAAEGETLQNRFRVLRITNNSAEVEEVASGRRATVQIEEAPPIA
ncbi:MAG TPA: hypothetical protein VI699_06240 [Candidatus Acidoferrales bacterium]|nr:hypothetical protein [Candidatus Acidoferrales bacterium]